MEFKELLRIVGDEPVFDTGLMLAGDVEPGNVRRQLSRWTKSGRLFQLRRGLYALAPPYQAVKPHPFLVANRMVSGSYVSLQSALAYHGLIPEFVPTVTSVTTGRPNEWETPLGRFAYRHIRPDCLHGYRRLQLGQGQAAFVALPEKAILDLVYLTPGGDSLAHLTGLRLENLAGLDVAVLKRLAKIFERPKIYRAAARIEGLRSQEITSEART